MNPTVADSVGGGSGGGRKRTPKAACDPDLPRDGHADQPPDPVAPGVALPRTGMPGSPTFIAALLLATAAAPFLKGVLAGFALAGAAAAVRDVLGV